MIHLLTEVLEAAAFDSDGKRDPARDDVMVHDEGLFPDDDALIEQFVKNRYPQAVQIKTLKLKA